MEEGGLGLACGFLVVRCRWGGGRGGGGYL